MLVVRPARVADVRDIELLLEAAGHGLTTLPRDADLLSQRVIQSLKSFETAVKTPGRETYLFVLEDLEKGRAVGTCGVLSRVGGAEPFYSYRLESHVHQSRVLGVRKEVPCLHLVAERSGPTEIGSLFLSPAYRSHGSGRLLSLARFLFIAEAPERFEREVIAEMRGVVDGAGRSPFWEAVGRHFFDVDFPRADYLSVKDKHFIAELMPTHPIYLALLPAEAREVVGKVHPETAAALRLLEEEGFRFLRMVDIFDGGPVVGCPRAEIRTVRGSRSAAVARVDARVDSALFLLARGGAEFRACLGHVREEGGGVVIESSAAEALRVERGGRVRWAPLRPEKEGVS